MGPHLSHFWLWPSPTTVHFNSQPVSQNNIPSGKEIIARNTLFLPNWLRSNLIPVLFGTYLSSLPVPPLSPPLLSIRLQSQIWLCLQSPALLRMCADLINPNATLYKLLINHWLLSANTFFCTKGLLMKGKLVLHGRDEKRRREAVGEAWDDMLIRNAWLQQHYSISFLQQGQWFRIPCWFSSVSLLY